MTSPVVLLSLGKVRGKRAKTRNGRQIYSFRSVPYALPPVGELRFRLPVPAGSWIGSLDASTRESPQCPQVSVLSPESKIFLGSEDCLYLNVFTPHLPGAGRRALFPVMVFFHGGAFNVGSNHSRLYGPDYLLDYGVVLVSVNYRIGPLGFLSLECDDAPGNLGLHDQVLALKWVHEHIGCFGGDRNNVTLFGESAGAMSNFLHLVSPLSRGLFHKVIALSGSGSTPFLHNDRKPSIYAKAMVKALGIDPKLPNSDILLALQALPVKAIMEKSTLFKDWDVTNPLPWKPIVDDFATLSFLPQPFQDLVQQGHVCKNIPILAGCNSEEGLILSAPFHKSQRRWDLLFTQWEQWAPQLFFNRETDLITESDQSCVSKIKERFFPGAGFPPRNDLNLKRLEQIYSLAIFQAPLARDLKLLFAQDLPIYSYNFQYQGPMSMVDLFRLPVLKMLLNFSGRHLGAKFYQKQLGVCHGDDLFYIFPFSLMGFPSTIKSASDLRTSEHFLALLTNFAHFGNPTPENKMGFKWEPWSEESKLHLNIGAGLAMGSNLALDSHIKFWNQLLEVNKFEPSRVEIRRLHSAIAERRNLVTDASQLLS
ncbi:hypothetical protein TCAL_10027 [Tigriopus californicus]|uniref:Carboxylic ester hydrolase n=1 Tax=Tigriopus californicus TaxID=6832 RepID=A0A553NZ39_TIGCA|nr:juvenile hormone esterase-like [Tigriopus californicus]XP_059090519.1 juvenile hormone esterase-like [Tigriopus californicus]XP_059090520.1 juvenile hormone esterase-like [Tigriopus californicus]TRY70685.1 hypothetical protein TCAL_10027 [Tigriopus californicus]